jgi:aryl-alcohol dehydrogenase-like predicted oxidoreductase
VIDEVELAPDYRISRLIRGGWQQHAAGTLDPVAEAQNLHAFANAGITAFETADTYRGVDSALARMLAERRAAGQALPRIHTRITLPRDVGEAVAETSRRLGQDVLDLVQLQSWGPDRAALTEAALRLRELSSQGRLRHVGLMNVDADIAAGIVAVGAKPLTLQAQCSLLDRRAFATLAPFAVESRIHLLAYGPLAGGFLTERWLGRPDPGLAPGRDVHFHKEYRIVIEEFGGWRLFQRLLQALANIARPHGIGLSAVALRWVLDQPAVAAALVGASSPARLAAWHEVFSFQLTAMDRSEIADVLRHATGPRGPVGGIERDPAGPFARAIAEGAARPSAPTSTPAAARTGPSC